VLRVVLKAQRVSTFVGILEKSLESLRVLKVPGNLETLIVLGWGSMLRQLGTLNLPRRQLRLLGVLGVQGVTDILEALNVLKRRSALEQLGILNLLGRSLRLLGVQGAIDLMEV
jgi:hypothetical protein